MNDTAYIDIPIMDIDVLDPSKLFKLDSGYYKDINGHLIHVILTRLLSDSNYALKTIRVFYDDNLIREYQRYKDSENSKTYYRESLNAVDWSEWRVV